MTAKEITLIIPTKLMAMITCSPRLSFLKGPIMYRDMIVKVMTEAERNVKMTTDTDILMDINTSRSDSTPRAPWTATRKTKKAGSVRNPPFYVVIIQKNIVLISGS